MVEGMDNLVLEHLRHIRKGVDELRLDVTDLKTRMTVVEAALGQIVTLIAGQSGRMDRIEDRLGRVERRLELMDA
jgi:hypothetical protein